jgi:hypothetical protein
MVVERGTVVTYRAFLQHDTEVHLSGLRLLKDSSTHIAIRIAYLQLTFMAGIINRIGVNGRSEVRTFREEVVRHCRKPPSAFLE